jgi:DNA primase
MIRMPRRSSRSLPNPLPSDILLTLGDLGVTVDKISGDEAWALCPNPKHEDRSASWSINLTTGEHNCFSCGWGGNYLYLVCKANDWWKDEDVERAVEWVRKHGGIDVARKKLRGEKAYEREKAIDISEADLALFEDPPASELKKRDIDLESALAYGLRWDPKTDRWIIPIRDPFTNKLLGWQEKGGRRFLNYPDNVQKAETLFGYHLLGEVAYLEESPLDCGRLHTWGLDGAVSGYGVHVSEFQMELILDKSETLYCCLDNDDAGRAKEAEIWRLYRGQVRLLFANYEHVQGRNYKKDHGEMTVPEIEYSLDSAISSLRFRP